MRSVTVSCLCNHLVSKAFCCSSVHTLLQYTFGSYELGPALEIGVKLTLCGSIAPQQMSIIATVMGDKSAGGKV